MPDPEALVSFLAPSDWREQLDGADAVHVFESWIVPSLFDDDETVEALKKAIKDLQVKENSACYWDGANGSREIADDAHEHVLDLVDKAFDALRGDTDA